MIRQEDPIDKKEAIPKWLEVANLTSPKHFNRISHLCKHRIVSLFLNSHINSIKHDKHSWKLLYKLPLLN